MAWNKPHKWVMGEPITAERMNAITDNVNYLYDIPLSVAPITGATHSITTAWEIVQGASVVHDVSIGRSLVFNFRSPYIYCLTALKYAYFDILINKKIYLSSLTTTATTYGSFVHYFATNGESSPVRFFGIWQAPHEGMYQFDVIAKATTTVSLGIAGAEFSVMEV
jgi:hypothetical protein